MRFYKTSKAETEGIINNMNIYHPYGQAGFLPFQKEININTFGNVQVYKINILSSLIKTFMLDNINTDIEYQKARNFLYCADKVFFLGFAFYQQNIDLLFPQRLLNEFKDEQGRTFDVNSSQYYGTFYKISSINQNEIIQMIKIRNGHIINFIASQNKCVDFFNEFSNIISFN